jgi:hypothetical protein
MNAQEAVSWVDPAKWRSTSAEQKLAFLKEVRTNLGRYMDELVQVDCEMKGIPLNDEDHIHQRGTALQLLVIPVGNTVNPGIEPSPPWS